MAAWSDGNFLADALDGALGKLVGAVEGVGQGALNAISFITGGREDSAAALGGSDAGAMVSQAAAVIAPTTRSAVADEDSLQSVMGRAGNTISSAVSAVGTMVSTSAQQLMNGMQDMGKGTEFLAFADLPNVQPSLPSLGGAAMGRTS